MSDKIFIPIFVICVLVILIIVGLHFNGSLLRQRSMLNNNDNININLNNIQENFQTSSRDEVKMGASTFYDWGITKNKKDKDSNNKPHHKPHHKHRHCKHHKEYEPKCFRCVEQDQNYIKMIIIFIQQQSI